MTLSLALVTRKFLVLLGAPCTVYVRLPLRDKEKAHQVHLATDRGAWPLE